MRNKYGEEVEQDETIQSGGTNWLGIGIATILTLFVLVVSAVFLFNQESDTVGTVPTAYVLTPWPTATMDPRVPEVRRQISDLDSDISELEAQRDNLLQDTTNVETEISEIESQISVKTVERDGLVIELQQIETEISSLTTSIGGRQVVLQEAQMQAATINPVYFAPVLAQLNSSQIIFGGLSGEYSTVGSGNSQLVETGVTFEYCDMDIRFEYNDQIGRVYLYYVNIRSADRGYANDRVSDGGVFSLRGAYAISEAQISPEVIDQATPLQEGFSERTRIFLLMDVIHNQVYCSQSGDFLTDNFAEWEGFITANTGFVNRPYWISTVPVVDLR